MVSPVQFYRALSLTFTPGVTLWAAQRMHQAEFPCLLQGRTTTVTTSWLASFALPSLTKSQTRPPSLCWLPGSAMLSFEGVVSVGKSQSQAFLMPSAHFSGWRDDAVLSVLPHRLQTHAGPFQPFLGGVFVAAGKDYPQPQQLPGTILLCLDPINLIYSLLPLLLSSSIYSQSLTT